MLLYVYAAIYNCETCIDSFNNCNCILETCSDGEHTYYNRGKACGGKCQWWKDKCGRLSIFSVVHIVFDRAYFETCH